jgi:hypothetical protein
VTDTRDCGFRAEVLSFRNDLAFTSVFAADGRWDLGKLVCPGARLARVLAGLMARRIEIEPSIVVLLTMSSTGAPINNLDGEIQGHYTLVWNEQPGEGSI